MAGPIADEALLQMIAKAGNTCSGLGFLPLDRSEEFERLKSGRSVDSQLSREERFRLDYLC